MAVRHGLSQRTEEMRERLRVISQMVKTIKRDHSDWELGNNGNNNIYKKDKRKES